MGVIAAGSAIALVVARPADAAEPPVFQQGGFALGGTDPVAYFTQAQPLAGDPSLVHDWQGARWAFAEADHRDRFAAAPESFAPAFGGYCAFAAARGYLAPTIPEAWHIHDGRLFLNASMRVLRRWRAELPDVIAQGDANWPGILG
ncbi:twin-arginine translocation pathway signal sequence domain protein, putative [Roseibacterium elongatum DSM 19469]|uniref:Twin-arginine translocation pathway signal sequence domain protein, putative n=1 Tax=Roseicyclus elongatus DSM 19469 TaxID=1294273 RepID=W8RTU0_9RHOB|nr:twin-arginine translocation pathway signal sequence domain protein, putative [Roseibacterium elongatum DSM 19469]